MDWNSKALNKMPIQGRRLERWDDNNFLRFRGGYRI